MNKDKTSSKTGTFLIGIIGVITGTLISSTPFQNMIGFNEKAQAANTTVDVANRLSTDFISVSRDVTPSIVTINSAKIVRTRQQVPELFNDPRFRRYFNIPDGYSPQEQESRQEGIGSGVIVDKSGLILTNNHVVAGASEISVTLQNQKKYKATIVGTDPMTDVAVIKVNNAPNLPVAKLGNSNNISVGEWVLAIGNPLGLSSTVTSGIISAKGRANVGIADFEDFIQTDAAINPGNSGGALVNLQGEVIGINTAIASKTGGYMGIGFAIPSNMAKTIMNELVSTGRISRGYLGVSLANVDENIAKRLGVQPGGIIVAEVVNGSPASNAGIRPNDIIIGINGNTVTDVTSFRNTIASVGPGKTAQIVLVRNGNRLNVNTVLQELPNRS